MQCAVRNCGRRENHLENHLGSSENTVALGASRAKTAIGDRMPDEVEFLKRLYDRFNARDMEKLLAAMPTSSQ
jgi:hypothetical protein